METLIPDLYYTPSISEFHVGFQYEVVQDDFVTSHEMSVFDNILDISNDLDQGSIRVKVLTTQQLESMGFIQEGLPEVYSGNLTFSHEEYNYSLVLRYGAGSAFIVLNSNEDVLNLPHFAGEIRNINELTTLIHRLGLKPRTLYAST